MPRQPAKNMGFSTVSINRERADRARRALNLFNHLQTGEPFVLEEEIPEVITDLMTDMMHLTDPNVLNYALFKAYERFKEEEHKGRNTNGL